LDTAWTTYPERFTRRPEPKTLQLPDIAWINPPLPATNQVCWSRGGTHRAGDEEADRAGGSGSRDQCGTLANWVNKDIELRLLLGVLLVAVVGFAPQIWLLARIQVSREGV
jgi:hypothetical protein